MMREWELSIDEELILQSYLDGELDILKSADLERHLKNDPRWANAEREMRDMMSGLVCGFIELDGNVRRSQVGSLPNSMPAIKRQPRAKSAKSSPPLVGSSLTVKGAVEVAREIEVFLGMTIEKKTFLLDGRTLLLQVATSESLPQVQNWLLSPYVPPSGMVSVSRRLKDQVAIRLSGELPEEELDRLQLVVA